MADLRSARCHVVDPASARFLRQALEDMLDQYTPGAAACHRPLHPSSPSSSESSTLRALAAALLVGGSADKPSFMAYYRSVPVFFRVVDATLAQALRLRHGSAPCRVLIKLDMLFVLRWGNRVWRKIAARWAGS